MNKYIFVLVELGEAKRYILKGTLPYLRLGLLLLDNAAEMQMNFTIQNAFRDEILHKQMQDLAKRIPEDKRDEIAREWLSRRLTTKKERIQIERYFDDKLDYLKSHNQLTDEIAITISRLHKYRNEAYHHAKIRKETLYTAALLYFHINCHLLQNLPVNTIVLLHPNEIEYKWLQEFFKVDPNNFLDSRIRTSIAHQLKQELHLKDVQVIELLSQHILDRVEEVRTALEFIVDNSNSETLEEALRDAQYFTAVDHEKGNIQEVKLSDYVPEYQFKDLESAENASTEIAESSDVMNAFKVFATIETEIEKVEFDVFYVASQIDMMIESQISDR